MPADAATDEATAKALAEKTRATADALEKRRARQGAGVDRQLARMEGTLEAVKGTVEDFQPTMLAHMREDATNFATLHAGVKDLKETVDRIKKPVDAFISLRNLIVGLAALLSAIGLLVTGLSHGLGTWLAGFFH